MLANVANLGFDRVRKRFGKGCNKVRKQFSLLQTVFLSESWQIQIRNVRSMRRSVRYPLIGRGVAKGGGGCGGCDTPTCQDIVGKIAVPSGKREKGEGKKRGEKGEGKKERETKGREKREGKGKKRKKEKEKKRKKGKERKRKERKEKKEREKKKKREERKERKRKKRKKRKKRRKKSERETI